MLRCEIMYELTRSIMNKQTPQKQDSDRLYNLYIKPLEKEHQGKYATVDFSGRTSIAPTLVEAIQKADKSFGSKQTITYKIGTNKIGTKVVGRIR